MMPDAKPAIGSKALWWARLVLRPIGAGAAVWLLFQVPFPILDDWLPLKNIVGAGLGLGLAGKCLYDTLYFDRYWP